MPDKFNYPSTCYQQFNGCKCVKGVFMRLTAADSCGSVFTHTKCISIFTLGAFTSTPTSPQPHPEGEGYNFKIKKKILWNRGKSGQEVLRLWELREGKLFLSACSLFSWEGKRLKPQMNCVHIYGWTLWANISMQKSVKGEWLEHCLRESHWQVTTAGTQKFWAFSYKNLPSKSINMCWK